jgi:NAD-dependent DNA ligase
MFSKSTVSELTQAEAEVELRRSAKELLRHDDLYYNHDSPAIDDAAYDSLVARTDEIERRFPLLRTPDSRSKRVGVPPASDLPKLKHGSRLLSLKNAYDDADVTKFVSRVAKGATKMQSETEMVVEFIGEPKVDGAMASVKYVDGVLHSAATRGDGVVGEDVTQNIQFVKGVPSRLPALGGDMAIRKNSKMQLPSAMEVRGEVYMEEGDFQQLNRQRRSDGQAEFVTARNAAAGSLRQLDPLVTEARRLRFLAYEVLLVDTSSSDSNDSGTSGSITESVGDSNAKRNSGYGSDDGDVGGGLGEWAARLTTQSEALDVLRRWGFGVQDHSALVQCKGTDTESVAEAVQELTAFYEELGILRADPAARSTHGAGSTLSIHEGSDVGSTGVGITGVGSTGVGSTSLDDNRLLPYGIDGVVYKANDIALQRLLGQNARAPRWAVAHKFSALQGTTVVERIEITVGRTGVLTPVAVVCPVSIGGVTIARVNLHSEKFVRAMDVREGDAVLLQRAGDVIPQLVQVLGAGNDDHGTRDGLLGDAFDTDRGDAFVMPSACPVCGGEVVQVETQAQATAKVRTAKRKAKAVEKAALEKAAAAAAAELAGLETAEGAEGVAEAAVTTVGPLEEPLETQREEGIDESVWRCTGRYSCSAQSLELLCHFVSRGAMDMRGLGRKQLELLQQEGWVNAPSDLFKLGDDASRQLRTRPKPIKKKAKKKKGAKGKKEEEAAAEAAAGNDVQADGEDDTDVEAMLTGWEWLEEQKGYGPKKVDKLKAGVEEVRVQYATQQEVGQGQRWGENDAAEVGRLGRFIFGLGIQRIGLARSKEMAAAFLRHRRQSRICQEHDGEGDGRASEIQNGTAGGFGDAGAVNVAAAGAITTAVQEWWFTVQEAGASAAEEAVATEAAVVSAAFMGTMGVATLTDGAPVADSAVEVTAGIAVAFEIADEAAGREGKGVGGGEEGSGRGRGRVPSVEDTLGVSGSALEAVFAFAEDENNCAAVESLLEQLVSSEPAAKYAKARVRQLSWPC